MNAFRFDLDSGGRHFLLFQADLRKVGLHHSEGSRRSILHDALKRHLRLMVGGGAISFGESDAIELDETAGRIEIRLGDLSLGEVETIAGAPAISQRYLLSPFESRFLADSGQPHVLGDFQRSCGHGLTTDLHVHFAGCVSSRDLLRIGVEAQVRYPVAYLEEVGIHPKTSGEIPLGDLPEEFRQRLADQLSIPLDRRVPFVEMERIYRFRRPITKNLAAFLPLIRQIARDYAAMDAGYVELSLSDIVEAQRLRLVHEHVPAIERETGVTLRFLAALGRRDDLEWDLDLIERITSLGQSRYIAGVDFMGHEVNSTRHFARHIGDLAKWADKARPGFAIRVHAGENPAYPENVRVAMEAVAGCRVQLRIGHGLYGVDDATLAMLRESATIVEFNLNSNLALNNIQSALDAPIVRYLKSGVAVVLGTDGYGIYQTTLELEARAALLSGVRAEDFEAIRQTERRYLKNRRASDERYTADPADYKVPDDLPHRHYVAAVLERKAEAVRLRDAALLQRLGELARPLLDRAAVNALLRGRRCISIAGAWNKSWNVLAAEQQQSIRNELQTLFDDLEKQSTVILTGGTRMGVEGVVAEIALPLGFTVLGTIVKETPPDWLAAGSASHFYVVAERLYDKAAGLYTLVKENDGLCLFVGGGSIVNDEIQTAVNLRLPYLLMDGVSGASVEHARQRPGNAFRRAEDVLAFLQRPQSWGGSNQPYWHRGANPTVDIVVRRRAPGRGTLQVLLILRDADAPTEGGKWALPGGFQHTTAPRGSDWRRDVESAEQACVRELREETGLDLGEMIERLIFVGSYEGNGRDPRDTPEAWSRAEVFAIDLPDALAEAALCGADDACDARWFDLEKLPELAFDHGRILRDGVGKLG